MPDRPGTREQERAQAAFRKVSDVSSEDWKKHYGRQCLHLPALIHQCGLCQALTFLESKGADDDKKPWFHRLLDDLAHMMDIRGRQALTETVRNAPLSEYQRLTLEALKCAQWFKRYAEAILKVEPGVDEGTEAA